MANSWNDTVTELTEGYSGSQDHFIGIVLGLIRLLYVQRAKDSYFVLLPPHHARQLWRALLRGEKRKSNRPQQLSEVKKNENVST